MHFPDSRALLADPVSNGFLNTKLGDKGKSRLICTHKNLLHQIHSQEILIKKLRQCSLLDPVVKGNVLRAQKKRNIWLHLLGIVPADGPQKISDPVFQF